jgi:peptidoglycan/LPS O-acetylase OafA/YrhL
MAFLAFCRKLTQSLTISIALFAAVCVLTVFLLPVLWPSVRPDLWHRLARTPLLLVGSGALSILCAAIARKSGWSARSSVGIPAITISATSVLLAIFVPSANSFQFLTFGALGWPMGMLCGKLVYPSLRYSKKPTDKSPEYVTGLKLNP